MGVSRFIDADKYPEQGMFLGSKVDVIFNYDTSKVIKGEVVRDDMTEPGLTIILLEGGRVILGTECQFSISKKD